MDQWNRAETSEKRLRCFWDLTIYQKVALQLTNRMVYLVNDVAKLATQVKKNNPKLYNPYLVIQKIKSRWIKESNMSISIKMNNVLKLWPCSVSGILANRNEALVWKDLYTNIYCSIACIGKQTRKQPHFPSIELLNE